MAFGWLTKINCKRNEAGCAMSVLPTFCWTWVFFCPIDAHDLAGLGGSTLGFRSQHADETAALRYDRTTSAPYCLRISH